MKLKNKYFLLLIFCNFFLTITTFSKEVTINEASEIARYFHKEHHQAEFLNLKIIDTISDKLTISDDTIILFYIFNFSPNGFVIVSATDNAFPILAYSDENRFEIQNLPENIQSWLESSKVALEKIINNNIPSTDDIKKAWRKLSNKEALCKEKTVLPLLKSKWGQGVFYNDLCPESSGGSGGRCPAGCVAVSLAQTLYYYNYPQYPTGYSYYTCDSSPTNEYINFGSHTLFWNDMKDSLNTSSEATAELIFLSGVSVNTFYSSFGSGATTSSCVSALVDNFKYSHDITYISRMFYNDSAWNNILKINLDKKMPIIYRGCDSSETNSHSFVCDGYNGNDYFHFNWGWNGYDDGYFFINNLNPAVNYSFRQAAVINIYPDTINYYYPEKCSNNKLLSAESQSFDDGSGPLFPYRPNNDCSWLIAPSNAKVTIQLELSSVDTELGKDILYIYDGPDENAQLIASVSGHVQDTILYSTMNRMYLRFVTNDSVQGSGWVIKYKINYADYVKDTTFFYYDQQASIDDYSGNYDYYNNINYKWIIQPENINYITVSIDSIDTETGMDNLEIFDLQNTIPVCLKKINGKGNNIIFRFKTDKILLKFTTNSSGTFPGWKIHYTTEFLYEKNTDLYNFACFPNPATNILNIQFEFKNEMDASISLTKAVGIPVYLKQLENFSGIYSDRIDLTKWEKGVYILKLKTENKTITKRIEKL